MRVITVALVLGLALLTAVEVADLLVHLDNGVLDALVARRTAGWTNFMTAVSHTGASVLTYPLVLVAGAVVAWRTGRWRPGVLALAVVVLGVLSRLLLSVLIHDSRPARDLWLVHVGGYSFPSGHAAGSALLAGALIWLGRRAGLPRPAWTALSVVALTWAFLVALSRLYLGVHWISDVVGSWLLAAAWLSALPLLDPLRRQGEVLTAVRPESEPAGPPLQADR